MTRLRIFLLQTTLVLMLVGTSACGKDAPAPAPSKSVSKKIAIPAASTVVPAVAAVQNSDVPETAPELAETKSADMLPTAVPVMKDEVAPENTVLSLEGKTLASLSEPAAATEEMPDAIAVPGAALSGEQAGAIDNPAPVVPTIDGAADLLKTSALVKESLLLQGSYDPSGRINPFAPLFSEQPAELKRSSKGKREKRAPQTPLERVALSQLKVTAVIRAPSGNRALVEDATGKGYVVQNGVYIGLNSGRVVEITNDRIVVEEEIEDVMGELKIQSAELKLQKPAGEL